jgi:hypothetical protein
MRLKKEKAPQLAVLIAQLGACVLPEVSAAPAAPPETSQLPVESSAPSVNAAPSSTPAGAPGVATTMTQSALPDSGAVEPMSSAPEPGAQPASSPPPSAASSSASCPPNTCRIDGECVEANAPRPRSLCEYCDPAKNQSAWTPRPEGTSCDDGVYCNGTGRCGPGGVCVTEERPCPENGDVCRTCNDGLKQCGYATASWIWTDPTYNLQWWRRSTQRTTLVTARDDCSELVLCGESDWHLATIDELRTLVRGCPASAAQGACGVTDACTSYNCMNDSCDGCGTQGDQSGWYCADEAGIVYPGIMMSGTTEASGATWMVNCSTGAISTNSGATFGEGRCVRNAL